ncbi:MAG: hypothetical protein KGI75_24680, partial [Rhizobiaceae bacterium]|nr:hypothetical protein [Rhizobiaceae bacterium]
GALNAGTYSLAASGLASDNYDISYVAGQLVVTPRSIVVTANDQTRGFGSANPALTYTIGGDGLVGGDSLSGAVATSAGLSSAAGSYAITEGTLSASSNYTVAFIDGVLTVTAQQGGTGGTGGTGGGSGTGGSSTGSSGSGHGGGTGGTGGSSGSGQGSGGTGSTGGNGGGSSSGGPGSSGSAGSGGTGSSGSGSSGSSGSGSSGSDGGGDVAGGGTPSGGDQGGGSGTQPTYTPTYSGAWQTSGFTFGGPAGHQHSGSMMPGAWANVFGGGSSSPSGTVLWEDPRFGGTQVCVDGGVCVITFASARP